MKKEYFLYVMLGCTILRMSTAHASCVATPECDELGYTSTSCPYGGVKCPWDTSKLFCGCDGIYKYKCDGRGYDGGNGQACEDKYTSCKCANRYKWENGACVLDCSVSACNVGSIVYSDGSCSYCRVENKTPVGVIGAIAGNNRYVVGLNESLTFWMHRGNGYSPINVEGITDIKNLNDLSKELSGRENTIACMDTAKLYYPEDLLNSIACAYCYNYVTPSTSKGQWFLPSAIELYAIAYTNIKDVNDALLIAGGKPLGVGYYYWSSSEYGTNDSWFVHAGEGYGAVDFLYKVAQLYVRCAIIF